jgi:hypothetical protein
MRSEFGDLGVHARVDLGIHARVDNTLGFTQLPLLHNYILLWGAAAAKCTLHLQSSNLQPLTSDGCCRTV